ncbi:MAG: riboflavin synthase [Hydrogenibacillus schlegelii]|nr:riboflavin synthase [Hydrogenibacillus schlegelii]
MFTGLIEAIGTIRAVEPKPAGGRRLLLELPERLEIHVGDSLAVDGVCLTAVDVREARVAVDVVLATERATTLGEAAPGRRVNVERALSAGGRFGGHFVTGHVDGIGTILAVRPEAGPGAGTEVWIEAPAALAPYLVPKGSIAVDGVSLTIQAVEGAAFQVALIPHTAAATTLGEKGVGAPVNLEVDLIAKLVVRALEPYGRFFGRPDGAGGIGR